MKKNILKNRLNLPLKAILLLSAGMLVASCSSQMSAYSESDGVYYNPNKDTLPVDNSTDDYGNQVGNTYDYSNSADVARLDDKGIYNKNYNWGNANSNSDWGSYAGTDVNYNNWNSSYYGNYGYSPYGWNFGMSFGYSWGSPYNYYGYSPYWGYSGYTPYWNYGYYSPYYGYYSPYNYYGYGYYNRPIYNYRRSGASGNLGNTYQGSFGNKMSNGNTNSGFRDRGFGNATQGNTINSNSNNQGGFNRYRGNATYQNTPNIPRQTQQYEAPRNNGGFRNSNEGGGFRSSGGFGGGNSGGGGGFRSGGSSGGGGGRSGGFR